MAIKLRILLPAILLVITTAVFAQHSLEKIWETDQVLRFPEAPVFAPDSSFLFLSMVDGHPLQADGKGQIAKIGLDGKIINLDWVTGLDAPKGMGLYKGKLYIADLTVLAVVDIEKAKVVERIPVEDSRLLHNIYIDADGVVYVSDLFTGKVHKVINGKVSTYLENLQGPMGVLLDGDDFYVFTGAGLIKVDKELNRTTITDGMDGRANGIIKIREKEYFLTGWGGHAYYINADGTKEDLLDTSADNIAAGMTAYDPKNNIMYMTTDQHNTLCAFKIKGLK